MATTLDEIKKLSGLPSQTLSTGNPESMGARIEPMVLQEKLIARAATKDEVDELRKYVKQQAGKNFTVTQPTKGSLKGKTAVRAKGKFVNGRVAAAKIGKWLLKNGWVMLPGGTKAIQSILDSLKVRITQDPDGYEDFTLLMKKPTAGE